MPRPTTNITTRAIEHHCAGMTVTDAVDMAIAGRSVSPGARAHIESIVAAVYEGRERARLARRAQCSVDRMESVQS